MSDRWACFENLKVRLVKDSHLYSLVLKHLDTIVSLILGGFIVYEQVVLRIFSPPKLVCSYLAH